MRKKREEILGVSARPLISESDYGIKVRTYPCRRLLWDRFFSLKRLEVRILWVYFTASSGSVEDIKCLLA